MQDIIKFVMVPIHPAGWPFIAIFAIVSVIMGLFSSFLGWIGLILTLWCVYFFRDPIRSVPTRAGLIVSPGDGLVTRVDEVSPPLELDMGDAPVTRISIFLSVFDVHVSRIPVAGTVTKLHYHHGLFLNATLDKASEDNERQLVRITTHDQKQVGVVQIAGLIARRILCDLKENQVVGTGDRFGIIRFGSRMDVFLPPGVRSLACVGQRAVGGETVLADMSSSESNRESVKI